MKITPMMFVLSPSGPSRLFGTFCTRSSAGEAVFDSSFAATSGRLNSDQLPGRTKFATVIPITIATIVLRSSSPANLPAILPETSVVMSTCVTATKIKGGASAPSNCRITLAGISNTSAFAK